MVKKLREMELTFVRFSTIIQKSSVACVSTFDFVCHVCITDVCVTCLWTMVCGREFAVYVEVAARQVPIDRQALG